MRVKLFYITAIVLLFCLSTSAMNSSSSYPLHNYHNKIDNFSTQTQDLDEQIDIEATIEFVMVPHGELTTKDSDTGRLHKLTIKESFEIGKYEVTQKQWQVVMGFNPSRFKGEQLPVELITWEQAQEFIAKMNNKSSKYVYGLPRVTQWEYACLIGATKDYTESLDEMAWHVNNSGNSLLNLSTIDGKTSIISDNKCRTHAVGTKQANALGIHDMLGNVWEWCLDSPSYNSELHSIRGGSWTNTVKECNPIAHFTVGSKNSYVGFRLVRIPRDQ